MDLTRLDNLKIRSRPRADVLLVHFHCLHGPAETLPERKLTQSEFGSFRGDFVSVRSGVPMSVFYPHVWLLFLVFSSFPFLLPQAT